MNYYLALVKRHREWQVIRMQDQISLNIFLDAHRDMGQGSQVRQHVELNSMLPYKEVATLAVAGVK